MFIKKWLSRRKVLKEYKLDNAILYLMISTKYGRVIIPVYPLFRKAMDEEVTIKEVKYTCPSYEVN